MVEKLYVVFQRRFNLTFRLVLNPSSPLVTNEPTAHKVVIVGLEYLTPPLLFHESFQKLVVLENFGSVGTSPTRHTRGTAVHVMCCRNLKVAPLDVGSAQPVPHPRRKRPLPNPFHPLARANASNPHILERGQDPWHYSRWPDHVVIGHNDDAGLDFGQRLTHLDAFVGVLSAEDANFGAGENFCSRLQIIKLVGGCDNDQFVRLCGQNALKRGPNLIKGVVDRGNHHRNIIRRVGGIGWDRLRLVSPVTIAVHNKSDVSMQPEKERSAHRLNRKCGKRQVTHHIMQNAMSQGVKNLGKYLRDIVETNSRLESQLCIQ